MFRKRDPVCRISVNKKTPYFVQYQGKAYYFDTEACRDTFRDNPHQFIQKQSGGGLLAWIARGSKDVPKSCHECKIHK